MAKKKDTLGEKELKEKFRREAALHYAAAHKIDLPDDPTDKELIEAVDKFVRKQLKGRKEDDKFHCVVKFGGCGKYILDDDKYCWFCGDDVSENSDSGGFDGVLAAEGGTTEEPKEEPEAEEEVEEPEEPEAEKEPEIEEPEEPADEVSLDECTERIISLSKDSGVNAYDIGFELHRVQVSKAYKQGKHFTFEDYCQKVLGMERASAYNYIRINKAFDRDEIGGLTYEKLLQLSRVKNDKERGKLLKAAKPRIEGGKSMTRKELKAKVAEIAAKQPKSGKGKSTGRPPLLRYRKFVGDQARGKYVDEKKTKALVTDDEVFGKGIGLEVKLLKTGVVVEVVELPGEE